MKLGLDYYTIRWLGWSAIQLIEYVAGLGIDGVQLSARRHFRSLDESQLLPARRRAEGLGITVELGMGSIDRYSTQFTPEHGTGEEQLAATLRAAKFIGSPTCHVVLGGPNERVGAVPLEQHIEECVRVCRAVAPLAREYGIPIAFETHGDLLAREMLALVEEAGTDYVGVCLDTGNPATMAEDPLMTTEILAKYTVMSHIRDNRIWAVDQGAMVQGVPMGLGSVDFPAIVALLEEQSPGMIFSLEVLTARPPRLLSYLEPESDFWKPFPTMLARDLARYHALAQRGRAEVFDQVVIPEGWVAKPGDMSPPPGEVGMRLAQQARDHFEESVAYCKETLGLGERGRSAVTAGR